MARQNAHAGHEPGTREDCEACRALSYEPGWYKAMRDERVVHRDPSIVPIPDPDEVDSDVVVAQAPVDERARR